MLDDKASRAMEEVRRRGEALIDALNLSPEEKQYALAESQQIIDNVTEKYLDDSILLQKKVRPIAVAAAMAFSLTYFDKWVTEIERKFPHLGK